MFSHGYLIWFAVVDVQQQVAFDRQKIEELPYRLLQYTVQQDARATVIIITEKNEIDNGVKRGNRHKLLHSIEILTSMK
uniref:Uncharacterized protein n=1 Tax=Pristionchus pacificus TaxID=54126 RepID=A0A2A6B4Q3_PRIPA|eukprot:PDM60859.1 hypothetical protein PRIPAC_54665 [Pristionchus pacificus]